MIEKTSPENSSDERREYFRVEDEVILRFQVVDENSAIAQRIPEAFKQDTGLSLIRKLQKIDHDNSKLLRAINDHNRELEQYLKAINKKIDLLAVHLLNNQHSESEQSTQQVSISEGGLAFQTSHALKPNTCLALHLSLIPSHSNMVLFARVIHCHQQADPSQFVIACSFMGLSDSDRQLLARHIMQVQVAQKKNQQKDI